MANVEPTSEKCTVCGIPAIAKCSWCSTVVYCSKEHQREDWVNHKPNCNSYEIKENAVVGRYIAAKRPIKRGELIIREKPVVIGPVNNNGSVCLGCHNRLELKRCHRCSKCGWPLCSEACEASPHHKPECIWTVEKRRKKVEVGEHIDLFCVTVLRILYLSKESPDEWAKVSALKSHCEERRKAGLFEMKWHSIANFLRNHMRLEEFSQEEIVRICGIFQINAHKVPLSNPHCSGIYITSSKFEHSCYPNCSNSFSDEGEIIIRANVKVKKGEHFSITYTDPSCHTLQRWYHMKHTKYFSCTCPRCSDPTEFGTNFSAVSCPSLTCSGVVLPETFLRECFIWKCTTCSQPMSVYSVLAIYDEVGRFANSSDKSSVESILNVLDQLKTKVPPNFATSVDLKYTLAKMIGRNGEGLEALDMKTLDLKENLCRELLDLSYILLRSSCRLIGILHYELHSTLGEKAARLFNTNSRRGAVMLQESGVHLGKAMYYLKYEPQSILEGMLYKQALVQLEDFNNIYKVLGFTPLVAP